MIYASHLLIEALCEQDQEDKALRRAQNDRAVTHSVESMVALCMPLLPAAMLGQLVDGQDGGASGLEAGWFKAHAWTKQ